MCRDRLLQFLELSKRESQKLLTFLSDMEYACRLQKNDTEKYQLSKCRDIVLGCKLFYVGVSADYIEF